jgi:recombination protein RecA
MALPSSEVEKDYEDTEKMAVAAGFLTRALKRFITLADVYTATIIFINQFRANISTFARKESKPYGSRALQYAVSVSIELSRIKTEEQKTTIQAMIAKNKTGAGLEGAKVEYTIDYGKGFDIAGDTLTTALQYDIIQRKGTWWYYGDLKAQGLEQAKQLFPIDAIRRACIERTL